MFIKSYTWHLAILGVAGVLAMGSSCSTNSGGAPPPPPPPPITVSAADPTGDTILGAIGTVYDITNISMTRSAAIAGPRTTVSVTITFVQPVVIPPPGGSPTATTLAAIVGFDIDGNFSDGFTESFCGATGTYNNDEEIFMFSRLADGNYPIRFVGGFNGEATPFVSGNSITFLLGLATIGGAPLSFDITVGNGPNPTDCAPNTGYLSESSVRQPLSTARGVSRPWGAWKGH